jgi:hypothetical protein
MQREVGELGSQSGGLGLGFVPWLTRWEATHVWPLLLPRLPLRGGDGLGGEIPTCRHSHSYEFLSG